MRRRAALCGIALLVLSPAVPAQTPAGPLRVITLAPNLAELVCAAGACGELVAVSAYSDFPESLKTLPQIGDGFAVNYEAVLAQKPDLVLAWDGGTPPAASARLSQLGVNVLPITTRHLDDVADALHELGIRLGTGATADAAAQAYRSRLAALRARWQAAPPIRVVYQLGTSPAYVIGGGSPIDEALRLCGGVNVFGDQPQAALSVSAESLLAAHPEAVIYGGEDNADAMRRYWQRLPGAVAYKMGNLYEVDADRMARATPRMLDGVEQLCMRLDEARAKRAASQK